MEMCYDGALVMPSNYAVMDEEEMMYTEGGISIPNWLVAGAINLFIDAVVVGGARAAAKYFSGQVKKYGAKTAGYFASEPLRKKLIAKGISAGVASSICTIAAAGITVLTWALDPGGELAKYIDNHDGNPYSEHFDL